MYVNNRSNSYVENGVLFIRPTLTMDDYDEAFLWNGEINVDGGKPCDFCTNDLDDGCRKKGNADQIIKPIKSARIRSVNSFSFKYGKMEIKAKMPVGDWLWPAVWLLPKTNVYGRWPTSGELDVIEGRGNRKLIYNGANIGVESVVSAIHYGPNRKLNAFLTSMFTTTAQPGDGFHLKFHTFQLQWSPEALIFSLDDTPVARVFGDFWKRGNFDEIAPGISNPWIYGTKMAPFDQEFYITANLAIGGNGYFTDLATNPTGKPWVNWGNSTTTNFWRARDLWLPTWNLGENYSKDASLQIDYIKVWAL